jgi:hypothetical protein
LAQLLKAEQDGSAADDVHVYHETTTIPVPTGERFFVPFLVSVGSSELELVEYSHCTLG